MLKPFARYAAVATFAFALLLPPTAFAHAICTFSGSGCAADTSCSNACGSSGYTIYACGGVYVLYPDEGCCVGCEL